MHKRLISSALIGLGLALALSSPAWAAWGSTYGGNGGSGSTPGSGGSASGGTPGGGCGSSCAPQPPPWQQVTSCPAGASYATCAVVWIGPAGHPPPFAGCTLGPPLAGLAQMSCPPPAVPAGWTISASDPSMQWGTPGNPSQICVARWTVSYGGRTYTYPASGCGSPLQTPLIRAVCLGSSPTYGTVSYYLSIPPEPPAPSGWSWSSPPPGPPGAGPYSANFSVPACAPDSQKPITSLKMAEVGVDCTVGNGLNTYTCPPKNLQPPATYSHGLQVLSDGQFYRYGWIPKVCCGVNPTLQFLGWSSYPHVLGTAAMPVGTPGGGYPRWQTGPMVGYPTIGARPGAMGPASRPPIPEIQIAFHAPSSAGGPNPACYGGPYCVGGVAVWRAGWAQFFFSVSATPSDTETQQVLPIWQTVTYSCVVYTWETVKGKRVSVPTQSTCSKVVHSTTTWEQPTGFAVLPSPVGLLPSNFQSKVFYAPVLDHIIAANTFPTAVG